MKIAIVTLPLHTNYGGILQAYALQTVLERMGCEVEHLQPRIQYSPLLSVWKMPFVWGKRIVRKYVGGERALPIFENPSKIIRKNTDVFIASYIRAKYLNEEDWNVKLVQDYDAIIFGSDQIWRPTYALPLERYFGKFIETSSLKKIVYAASFGTDINEYTSEQIQECSNLLSKFKVVSVREQSAISFCRDYFGVEATLQIDPTLLLDSNDYVSLIQKVETFSINGTLGVYVLDENKQIHAIVDKISRQKGLKPFRVGSKVENHNAPIIERIQPPVEQWLRAFYDAEFIVTDSFHGTVFSILFHKSFICIGNKNRGMSRFYSLLKMFGLEDRLVDIHHHDNCRFSEINWDGVDEILAQKRKEAISFVVKSLN